MGPMPVRPSIPPVAPLYQQIEGSNPGLLPGLFSLQVSLARQVSRASSVTELNTSGQAAFESLNAFGDSIASLGLSQDELEFLSDCVDDVRIAIRGRAELQMLVLEGKAPQGQI